MRTFQNQCRLYFRHKILINKRILSHHFLELGTILHDLVCQSAYSNRKGLECFGTWNKGCLCRSSTLCFYLLVYFGNLILQVDNFSGVPRSARRASRRKMTHHYIKSQPTKNKALKTVYNAKHDFFFANINIFILISKSLLILCNQNKNYRAVLSALFALKWW